MIHRSSRILIVTTILFFIAISLSAKPEFEGSAAIDADTSQYWEEMLRIRATMEMEYDLASGMELELSLSLDEYEVNPDKIMVYMKTGENIKLGVGYNENFMTLEERFSSFVRPVNKISLLTEYYKYLGYVARFKGVEARNKNNWYTRGGISSIHPYEPQFNGSYFFHPFGMKSFYGISALYIGNYRTVSVDHGDNPHHFAFTLHAADTSGPWRYALESACGSNYPAPIGYMTLPTADSRQSFFLGFDGLIARDIPFRNMTWIPGIRYSILFPDAAYSEYFKQRAVVANQLYISEDAKVFVDFFLEHERPYLDISGDQDEFTMALFAGLQVKTH